jgi:protease-4
MNSVFLKIKNIFTKVNRGILKLSDWMINGFKVVLVVGVVLYALGIGWVVFYSDKVSLDEHTVLVMDLKGVLVEESPGGFKDKFIGELQGKANDTVRLRDLVMTLDLAAQDKHIDKVLLKLDDFQGGG